MRCLINIIMVFVFAICACASGNEPQLQKEEASYMDYRIDTLLSSAVGRGVVPGAVVAVVHGDSLVYLHSWGNRSLVPDTLPMTDSTMFDLASLTKTVATTTAVMQLVEQGRISLDDRVDKYIPDFKPWTDGADTVHITILDLLTHSSGIDAYVNVAKCKRKFGNNPDSLVAHIARNTGRRFRPRTSSLYSCLNFIALQYVVQNVTGKKLSDYTRQYVFSPLGMSRTSYFSTDSLITDPNIAPTEVQKNGLPLYGQTHDPLARNLMNGISGNAGLFSSAPDLARFCIAIMNDGKANGTQILKGETVKLMSTMPIGCDTSVNRVLGWDKSSPHSTILGTHFPVHNCLCHTGYTGTSIVMDLDSRTAVILLTNRVHPKDKGSLKFVRSHLADIVAESLCGF